MFTQIHNRSVLTKYYQRLSLAVTVLFTVMSLTVPGTAAAQNLPTTNIELPIPGVMVPASKDYTPALIRGLRVYPDNPLMFDFVIDKGEDLLDGDELQTTSQRLIKYFLASLTIPEDKMWVNLSPYEKDRIISPELEVTAMGRDLLGMDYMLKQLTASLMYPEDKLGRDFWDRVKKKAMQEYGTSDIPMNAFNKIWVIPAAATVFELDGTAYVVESRLKVMLEEDYFALAKHGERPRFMSERDEKVVSGITSGVVRDILIPEIEKEINQGRHFAKLRQIYDAMVLATWYKQNLRDSLLGQVYVDRARMKGIDEINEAMKDRIYQQYLDAFKVGVYNYVREDYDASLDTMIPRKFFSGGASMNVSAVFRAQTAVAELDLDQFVRFLTLLDSGRLSDPSRQQIIARIQAMEAADRDRIQELIQRRPIPDAGIARIVEVQISLLENAPTELRELADAAVLGEQPEAQSIQTVTLDNRQLRPEQVLATVAEVRRMLDGAAPVIDVPMYPMPNQSRPKLLLAAIREGKGDNPILNARWRDYEAIMNALWDAAGIFVYKDFTGSDFEGTPVERNFALGDVGGKIAAPAEMGTAFYVDLPQDPEAVDDLISRINIALDSFEAEARAVFDQNLAELMSPQTEGQVVVLSNIDFDTDALAVARFLTSGRANVLGLMGPANLPSLGFVDGERPKAIGFTRAQLESVGINVPESGVIDSDQLAQVDLEPIQESIRRLEEQEVGNINYTRTRALGEIITALNPRLNEQSPLTVQMAEATQRFMQPSYGFTGPEDVSPVFPILDIRIRDAVGAERTIWVHRRSPVLTDEVEILGIGPQTERVWRSIVENAAGVIVIGDTAGLEGVLGTTPAGQPRIQIASRDVTTLQELSRDTYWRDLSNRLPTSGSLNELAALAADPVEIASTDEQFQILDPRGDLAYAGVKVYVVDNLLQGVLRIAEEQGVQLGPDMLLHPGIVGKALYFSPQAIEIISSQPPEYRAALVRHHLAHVRRPELSESQINTIAPLPRLRNPQQLNLGDGVRPPAAVTVAPQAVVNQAIERLDAQFGLEAYGSNYLSPESERYADIDPSGILRNGRVDVFVVPDLIKTTLAVADELGVEMSLEDLIQPARSGNRLYVDPLALDVFSSQSYAYRQELAAHHMLQVNVRELIRAGELEYADVPRIVPLPQLEEASLFVPKAIDRLRGLEGEYLPDVYQELMQIALLELDDAAQTILRQQRIDPNSATYRRLDPDGTLAARNVTIFQLAGLTERVQQLAAERNLDIPLEYLLQPATLRGNLYFDPSAVEIITGQGREFRSALSTRLNRRATQPDSSAEEIDTQAPVPSLDSPSVAQTAGVTAPSLPRIRQGITVPQEELINTAVFDIRSSLETAEFLSLQREIEPGTSRYARLDPEGILAQAGVPIFVLPGLMDRVNELAYANNLDASLEVIMHPGVLDGALYLDPATLSAILAQSREHRTQLARHQLLHLQQPDLSEDRVAETAPLPQMILPAANAQRRSLLAGLQEKLSRYGEQGLVYLNEMLTQSQLFPVQGEGQDANLVLMAGPEINIPERRAERREFLRDVILGTLQEINPVLSQYLDITVGTVTRRRTGERMRALTLKFKNSPAMLQKLKGYFYRRFSPREATAVDTVLQRLFDADMVRTMRRLENDLRYAIGAMYSLQQVLPSFARRFPLRPIQQGVALAGPESTIVTPYILVQPETEGQSSLVAFVSGRQIIIRSGRIARTGTGLLPFRRQQDVIILDENPQVDIRQPLGADLRLSDAALLAIDRALEPDVPVGGIDLDAGLLDLQIKRDGTGIPLPIQQQPIENMNIGGFTPLIIKITPLTTGPALLNL